MRRSNSSSSSASLSDSFTEESLVSSRSSVFDSDLEVGSDVRRPNILNRSTSYAAQDYVMVIGGLGYIGSHTTLELLKAGHNVVVVDNLSNSYEAALNNIRKLASKHWAAKGAETPLLNFHKLDYRSRSMRTVLGRYAIQDSDLSLPEPRLSHITGVIHFAAHKSVEESTNRPLDYYLNNVAGLIELLVLLGDFGILNFVFSSSATVYGARANEGHPLREEHLVHHQTTYVNEAGEQTQLTPGVTGLTSPYGRTKYFGEAILADVAAANPAWRITALRYFNPVGCEPSGMLAEDPRQKPTNLFPVISQVLTGSKPTLEVFGSDWATRDGTAVRDFIHVVDLARGHVAAVAAAAKRSAEHAFRSYNLGSGTGSTVAQVISSMETASSRSLPVRHVGRRKGDVGYCVAATERATAELGWSTQHSLDECARDTWHCLSLSGRV